ncbi:KaiC domain-containing protein [Halorubrum sp. JWXQ-INN 858]|uniref:KaiC domain-containing protein n=1 Tax=Halorubrum sp. JWXQ-INN 858 TaxID=2690782 RepID=UPI00135B2DFF|nr:KaiC domain-containing protein [Halorubrum sp. JWXQ-INN 858]MWV63247.1 KaiC domain-containing protein [Halorubrum sp. JWXQ-INN 858]
MTDGDDDWFERALRELDEEDGKNEDAAGSDRDGGSEDRGPDAPVPAESDTAVEDDTRDPDPEPDPFGGVRHGGDPDADDRTGNDRTGNDRTGNDRADDETADDDSDRSDRGPTDADPSGTTRNAADTDDPFGGGRAGEGEDPFGGGRAGEGEDPFGGGGATEGEDPFGGDGDGFGFADFDGPVDDPPVGFDEEAEFESDIERIDVGIAGLDEMILGGVPTSSLLSVIGSAGTGKTTFGLQFLNEGAQSGEKAVYISLEQSRESMIETAEEKGWPFREYVSDGRIAVLELDPIEMANSLSSIRNDLVRLITDFGAERLVLDSVSLLEMMYDHPSKRRSEVFDFTRSLKQSGVTTLLTSEASEENAYASRHGIVEYLTDAVFVLQYVRPSDFRETRLAIEIQKIRDANHSRETKPYEITDTGISVYRQANIF